MIFTEVEAEVNIIYLRTIDPYIKRNESRQLFLKNGIKHYMCFCKFLWKQIIYEYCKD